MNPNSLLGYNTAFNVKLSYLLRRQEIQLNQNVLFIKFNHDNRVSVVSLLRAATDGGRVEDFGLFHTIKHQTQLGGMILDLSHTEIGRYLHSIVVKYLVTSPLGCSQWMALVDPETPISNFYLMNSVHPQSQMPIKEGTSFVIS